MSKISTKIFIEKSIELHGDKYDYSLIDYKNVRCKIKIICPIHGIFEQSPEKHLLGRGCQKCGKLKTRVHTTDDFIKNALNIHGDKYDYSLVEYKNTKMKVKIICSKHGIFEQTPSTHLSGRGCSLCNIITTNDFIIKAKSIHSNKYDYSLVDYKHSNKKIKIICKTHGIFEQTPHNHTTNKSICPKCSYSKKRKTLEQFTSEANKIHNNLYDYSLVNYKNNKIKIEIICDKHGTFRQKPIDHLRGCGCPTCNSSKGELEIKKNLEEKNIKFEPQKTFDGCKNINHLPFDFYLPEYNMCVEYDGIQHFKLNEHFGGKKEFKLTQKRDKIKTQYCKDNNIELLRIRYDEVILERLPKFIPNS